LEARICIALRGREGSQALELKGEAQARKEAQSLRQTPQGHTGGPVVCHSSSDRTLVLYPISQLLTSLRPLPIFNCSPILVLQIGVLRPCHPSRWQQGSFSRSKYHALQGERYVLKHFSLETLL
jgi:hypothetical protein